MFRVGQKVACVDQKAAIGTTWPPASEIFKDSIYTVRAMGITTGGLMGLRLVEVRLNSRPGNPFFADNFYRASRFRPLVSRETSIDIFTKMLTPAEVEA